MKRSMSQLPLELTLKPHASFDSFVAGPNQVAVEHVRAIAAGDKRESIWLFGQSSAGKSHLLSAACRAATEAGRTAIYLPFPLEESPAMLAELADVDLIAADDVDRAAGQTSWEAGLFSMFNARLDRGGLIAAASVAPRDVPFALADLKSRAAAAASYRLGMLDDDALRDAVIVHARERGIALDAATAGYLLQRVSRDLAALTASLDRIDRYALTAKRRITIPLLKEAMDL